VRCREPGAASSEAETHPRGRQALERGGGGARPSREAETRPRGRQALERGGESSEGYRGRSFGGSSWLLWAVGLSTLGCDHTEHVFGVRGMFVCVLLFF
jgi:hypothetical protein